MVTSQLGLRQWKLYVQIKCQLGYLMMLISNGICQYEGRYAALNENICHFLGPSPSETYTNDATLRSVTVPRFGFLFQDSRIRVKRRLKWTDRSKVDGPSTTSFKTSRLWAKSEIKIYSKVDAVNFRRAFALSFLAAQFHKWTSTFELNSYLVLRLAGQFAVGAKIWNLKKVILVGNKENISWKWKMR